MTRNFKTLDDMGDIAGKRVLVREDLNVPMAGIPITVATFIGSSSVRQYAEGWDLDFLLKATRDSVSLAARA